MARGTQPVLFGSRFSAWSIDAAIIFVAQWASVFVLSRLGQLIGLQSREVCGFGETGDVFCGGPAPALWLLIVLVLVITTFGYYAWYDGVHGATIGKRIMGLRVVEDHQARATVGEKADDHSTIGLGRGVIRAIVRQAIWVWALLFLAGLPTALSVPAAVWFVLGVMAAAPLAWAALATSGQGPADVAARSLVIEAPAGPAAPGTSATPAAPGTSATPAARRASQNPPAERPAPGSERGGDSAAFRSQLDS